MIAPTGPNSPPMRPPPARRSSVAILSIHSGKAEPVGGAPAPPAAPGRGRHDGALVGMDEAVGREQDPGMLGGQTVPPTEKDEVARRGFGERLLALGLGPVGRIGRRRLGFASVQLAPDAADKPEAVAADALQRGLLA